jgi:hypothetical protein
MFNTNLEVYYRNFIYSLEYHNSFDDTFFSNGE